MRRMTARLERAVLGALMSLVVTVVERRLRRGLAHQRYRLGVPDVVRGEVTQDTPRPLCLRDRERA
jgi:hypothetical protein